MSSVRSGPVFPMSARHGPPRLTVTVVVVCVVAAAIGVVSMMLSGQAMLDGDFTSRTRMGTQVTVAPPGAFLVGLGLALSPVVVIGIIVRDRRVYLRRHERWSPELTLAPDRLVVHRGPGAGTYSWKELRPAVMDGLPRRVRPVVDHYLLHPVDRGELGDEASVERAAALTRSG